MLNNTAGYCDIVTPDLLKALDRANLRLKYTDAKYVYHAIWLWSSDICGVFGDGPNGSYEWFIWRGRGKLETSDCGYGSMHIALRDGLNTADPPEETAPLFREGKNKIVVPEV